MSEYQSHLDSASARALVVEAVEQAAEFMDTDQVVSAWEQASVLDGMTVGALCAHLVRAAGATIAYLDRTDPSGATQVGTERNAGRTTGEGESGSAGDTDVLTPVTYFNAALEAPIHVRIKEVSATEASKGHADVVAEARRVAEGLARRLPDESTDRMVEALGGRALTLDDFCRTRLIEVLMHTEDLAASIGVEPPPTNPAATGEIIDILVGIARHRHGDWAVIRMLGRAERDDGQVTPVI